MERKEAIRSAHRLTSSSSFYDGMMTCSTLPGRLVCRLVWDPGGFFRAAAFTCRVRAGGRTGSSGAHMNR